MSRRFRKTRSDKVTGVALAVLGIVLIAGLAGGAFWIKRQQVPFGEDNCPTNGPKVIHIILIDRSDPITGQQAQHVRQWGQRLRNSAISGTRFDIYTFDGDTENELHPFLSLCAPPRPDHANPLIQNPERIRKRYEKKFATVFDTTIGELLQVSTRPSSPIIESLRAAAQTSFGLHPEGQIPLRVTLISDLIQHSTIVSHFRSKANFEKLSNDHNWPRLRPDLHGALVDVLYILRPSAQRNAAPIQNRGHQDYWAHLIAESGGSVSKFTPF